MARCYAASIPGAQLHVLPGEGHLSIGFRHNREILGCISGPTLAQHPGS
jgi:pimeloyl-ACP methyl ester carboxylesterase